MESSQAGSLPDPDRSRAVLIGTRSYTVGSGLAELPGVTGNIQSLGELLNTRTGLRPEHVRPPLLDETDDRTVCRQVRRAAREAEDLLLVYFAGHGLIEPETGDLFLALSASNPDDPLYSAVRFSEIREAVAASPARHRVIILDCCYSGRAIKDAMGGDATSVALGQTETRGACTIAAASANEPAIAVAGERHTVFTGALVRLLREGIPGAGPHLTLDRLYAELDRTLKPWPRRQGTDSVGELVLGSNPAGTPTQAAPTAVAPPMASQETEPPTGVRFTTNYRRLFWQYAMVYAAISAPSVALGYACLTSEWWSGEILEWLSVLAALLLLTMPLMAIRIVLRLIPGPYELLVGEDGVGLVANDETTFLPWRDIQSVTTGRTRRGRRTPCHLAVLPRRGFVPPPHRPFRPRLDRRNGALILCDLRRLRDPLTVLEATVARYAGPLWDEHHGLAHARSVRFDRTRGLKDIGLLLLPLPLYAVGWFKLHSVAACVLIGLLHACLVVIELLPLRVEMDDRQITLTSGFRRTRVAWNEVREMRFAVDDRIPGPSLVLGTDETQESRMPLMELTADVHELDAAFRKFGGARYRGVAPRSPATPDDSPAEVVFAGRLMGAWATSAGALPVVAFTSVAWATPLAGWGVWATALPVLLSIGLTGLVVSLRRRLRLRLDHEALHLTAGRRSARIPWRDVSRVTIQPFHKENEKLPSWWIVVWFKDGASVPAPWRLSGCFRPWSGGVRVIRCGASALSGVSASPVDVEQALRRFAGPAWQDVA